MFRAICLGLFDNFNKNINRLKKLDNKTLFMKCLFVSTLSMITVFLSQMVYDGGGSPHTIFYQVVSYYISLFLFLSVILTGLGIFYREINTTQFLSLFLLMDIPLIATLPFALISLAFPAMKSLVGMILFGIGVYSFVLKVRLFITYFKISLSQVLVLYSLPFVLILMLITTTAISVFNMIATLF